MVDYPALCQYLLSPLVSHPDEIFIDCETTAGGRFVLVRVALEATDRGKVLGKNSRAVNMIRILLGVAGKNIAQGVDINIYSEDSGEAPSRPRRNSRSRSGG